ncbi:MAG: hypothetical protein R6U01_07240 [Halorubrum sp.]|uniref:hypothetical protein n=1 Tax=Halorubrum sp. TaxID=1879286 RepID=UPI003970A245
MNLDELRSAQAKERRKDSLQHLRDSFYDDVAAYVADLRAARDRRAEQVDKPFSDDDVRRLSDEVETAEEVAEALYERRVGKVVKLASFAAADMPVDADGMTTEERRLFDDLVDRIEGNKSRVLDVLSGETPAKSSTEAPVESSTEAPAEPPSEAPASGVDPAADGISEGRRSTEEAAADPGDEPASPAPDPEPANGVPRAGSGGDADALAGAMGGETDEADTGDAADATTDGGPTAVPPEPAPPGAPGVDEREAVEEPDSGTESVEAAIAATDTGPADGAAGSEADSATEAGGDSAVGDRATVRITRDVGAIFGVDEREYDLASEDVVSLPVENAAPLVERDAAERLD